MGDSSGAYLFGMLFDRLAKEPDDDRRKKLVQFFWKEAGSHDFSDCEMECDDSLVKLGLAKENPDPEDHECPGYLYKRNGRWEE
jgi:hypothetical protein